MLKNTEISINRDFPKEILSARKELWPEFKALRRDNPNSRVSLVYPAKLIKDGRVYRDMFPKWNLILHGHSPNVHGQPVAKSRDDGLTVNPPPNTQQPNRPTRSEVPDDDQTPDHSRSDSAPSATHQRSRNVSRSPRRRYQQRGRAPSRRPSRQSTYRDSDSARSGSGTQPQFSRPWDDSRRGSSAGSAGNGRH